MPSLAMSNAFPNREPGPLMQYWAQGSETRMELSDAHGKESENIFEHAGMVQGHEMLSSFRFIRGDTLLRHNRFPSYD